MMINEVNEVTEINYAKIKELIKENKYDELNRFFDQNGYTTIPQGLVGNPTETKRTIEMLKIFLKFQKSMDSGKFVYSDEKGLKKEFKTRFLGYIIINREEGAKENDEKKS